MLVAGWMTESGERVEMVHCLYIKPEMKRGPWNGKLPPAVWLESIRQSSSWPGEIPMHGCIELGQMTSFWQDYPKPKSQIYTVHIIDFYNMTQKTSRRTDGRGFHTSTSLLCWSLLTDCITLKQGMHQNVISLQHHLKTFCKHKEMNSFWQSRTELMICAMLVPETLRTLTEGLFWMAFP